MTRTTIRAQARRSSALLAGLLAAALSACQGGGGDRGMAELSPAELCTLSDQTSDRIAADSARITCHRMAVGLAAEDGADCQAVADQCVAAAPAAAEKTAAEAQECDVAALPACAADIALDEVKTCLDAVATQVATFAGRVSCDTSMADFEAFDPFGAGLPAECRALEDRCPGLLD